MDIIKKNFEGQDFSDKVLGYDQIIYYKECCFDNCNFKHAMVYWRMQDCSFVNANLDSCEFEYSHLFCQEIAQADLSRIEKAVKNLFVGVSKTIIAAIISKIKSGAVHGSDKRYGLKGWLAYYQVPVDMTDPYCLENKWMGNVKPCDLVSNNVFLELTLKWLNQVLMERVNHGTQEQSRRSIQEDS